jgi:thiamine biosynthesis protein ThiS
MSAELRITVNGESRTVAAGASIADLLESLGVASPRIAVERNRDIVPKAEYAATALAEGDVFEVVELVGGG